MNTTPSAPPPTTDERGVIIACPACGQRTRLPYERLGQSARCPQCRQPLDAPDAPLVVPDRPVFEAMITRAALPVLIDFWADWCGPCKMVAPEFAAAARRLAGRCLLAKLDTEVLPAIAARYQIRGIPAFILFRSGRELARTAGVQPASALESFVRSHL